jgi:hypothetical protein
MKKVHQVVFLLGFIILNYCTTEPDQDDPRYASFKIKVDKISIPDTISSSDTLTLKFWGLVGTDGFHKFEEFETKLIGNDLHITLWGTKPNFETACPTVMVYLDGKEFKTTINQSGNYRIIIHQPDNSLLIESLVVI